MPGLGPGTHVFCRCSGPVRTWDEITESEAAQANADIVMAGPVPAICTTTRVA